jgi:hypothetical protein
LDGLETINRRKTKDLSPKVINQALENTTDWGKIHHISDLEEMYTFLMGGVNKALDVIAPTKFMSVCRGVDLCLQVDKLALMKVRDAAKVGEFYRKTKNRVSALVKETSCSQTSRSSGRPGTPLRRLWEVANNALGRSRPSLPDVVKVNGIETSGPAEPAEAVNNFYVKKVDKIREKLVSAPPPPTSDWPPKLRPFEFSYASATRITKIVKGLNGTEALGVNNIPVSVWKKGIEVLACPVAHLVNRSLALGVAPKDFKRAIVHPVYKWSSKPRAEPGSYRPVSVLTALSKVLEVVVKEDLEAHLDNLGALPNTQHGFR